jgi:16S rRNA (cytidine1402-2'-O)-methyltransferase
MASGIAGPRWGFEGFLPRSGRERRERLARIASDDRATVLFEAPTRLAATVRDLLEACGADRAAAICRELTKLHEQVARGSLAEIRDRVDDGSIPTRGEVVIVLAAAAPATSRADGSSGGTSDEDLRRALAMMASLVSGGAARSEAAKAVAAATGIPRRQLYGRGQRSS